MSPRSKGEDYSEILSVGIAVHAYITRDSNGCGHIVYAGSPEIACELSADDFGGDAECMTAERAPEHDVRALSYVVACIERDQEYLRNAGWGNEDEERCGSCGFAANGLEKYGVCRECHQCKECGCDEECEQTEGFSCE